MSVFKERISSEADQPPIFTNHDVWLQLAVVQDKINKRLSRSQVRGLMEVYDPTTPQSVATLAERGQNLGFNPTDLSKNPILRAVAFNYSTNQTELALRHIGNLITAEALFGTIEPIPKSPLLYERFYVPSYFGILLAENHYARMERFLQSQGAGRLILAGTLDQPRVSLTPATLFPGFGR